MRKGTKIIAAASLAAAIVSGTLMAYSNFHASQEDFTSCQQKLAAWQEAKAKADANPPPAAQAAPQPDASDASDPFADLNKEYALPAPTFESTHGAEPQCSLPGSNWVHVKVGAWIAVSVFAVLFVLTHIGWLVARAFNKAMDKLS